MIDVVASVQTAIEIVGKLRSLSKRIEDAEFKMLLADLSGELADTKMEVAELKTQLAKAIDENKKLADIVEKRTATKPTLSESVYRFEGEEGLFCTACFDAHEKKVRVTPLTGPFKTFGKWTCPSCKANYG